MRGWYGNNWGMMGNNLGAEWTVHYVLGIITWFLVICVLAALLRWLWKKGNK